MYDIATAIMFPMIDALLGGQHAFAAATPVRELTQIEQGLALQIVERAAGQLADKLSTSCRGRQSARTASPAIPRKFG